MKLRDLLSETFLSLTANKARSFLTVLGIVVGISSVIVMVSIGQGTKTSIESSITSMGSNLLMVSPGGQSSRRAFGGGGGMGASTNSLTLKDVNAIVAQVENVKNVAPQTSGSYQVSAEASNTNVTVTGTTSSYPGIRSVTLQQGAWFSDTQASNNSRVAVLGPTTAETLFGNPEVAVGRRIRVSGQPFTVIGVTTAKGGNGMTSSDDAVYLPFTTFQRHLSKATGVSLIYVEAVTQESMTKVKSDINDLLLTRHKITDSA